MVGLNDNAPIANSYSTGKVDGTEDVGALVGLKGGNVNTSYFNSESIFQSQGIGRGSSDGVTGLTTAEMKGLTAESKISQLSFDSIWGTIPNDYPKLLWSTPYFQIQSFTTNDPITEGKQLTIEVTINNIGGLADTQTVVIKYGRRYVRFFARTIIRKRTSTDPITAVAVLSG